MKKLVLIASLAVLVTSCKKSELTDVQNTLDSTTSIVNDHIDAATTATANTLDSSQVRIKEIQGLGEDAKKSFEETKKLVDSVSEKLSSVKLESAVKKDSAKDEKPQVVVNVPAPKVVKETKIVYKDRPKIEITKPVEPSIIKKGSVDINVDDLKIAKENLLNEVYKYDGNVKSENISVNQGLETGYYVVNLPASKFDYFMDDITDKIGKIENKNTEITGSRYNENSLSRIEINLYESNEASVLASKPESFSGKFFNGISSGWEVITNIFLFLIPFWPIYLIAGIGYYFYKKKNAKEVNS